MLTSGERGHTLSLEQLEKNQGKAIELGTRDISCERVLVRVTTPHLTDQPFAKASIGQQIFTFFLKFLFFCNVFGRLQKSEFFPKCIVLPTPVHRWDASGSLCVATLVLFNYNCV